ncbi:MAG: hypothetical protein OEQ39_07475 [Gammaproteobacteria bacterium]|nr:hypothetical protein [Gammaproteobacteria bacterium]
MKHLLWSLFFLTVASFASDQQLSDEMMAAIERHEEYFSQLDGVWEGEIEAFELNGAYPNTPYKSKMRLVISDSEISILAKKNNEWMQFLYDYKIIRHKTNAVIYTHASQIAWVETVSILVTLKTIDEMHVLWQRTVNNYATDPKSKDARGNFQAHAIFKRIDA